MYRNIRHEQQQFVVFLENYSRLENLLGLKRRWKELLTNLDGEDFAENGFEGSGSASVLPDHVPVVMTTGRAPGDSSPSMASD